MGMLKITDCTGHHYTSIDNAFIDSYMAEANGEYVKVYLLLLRRMGGTSPFSVSEFAEILENTEGDIIRALKYWAKRGLLTIEYGPDGGDDRAPDRFTVPEGGKIISCHSFCSYGQVRGILLCGSSH